MLWRKCTKTWPKPLSRSDVSNPCTFGISRPSAATLADGPSSCDFDHGAPYSHLQNNIPTFQTMSTERMNTVLWLGFPKRLLSALKGLCCLAQSQRSMQAPEIAERIGVSTSETGKVMQMLVWGGFVTSRRGSKGGFQLAAAPDQITTGDVVRFFFSKHQDEPDRDCPVVHVLRTYSAPCQEAFGRLTLADITAQHSRSFVAVAEKEELKHEAV